MIRSHHRPGRAALVVAGVVLAFTAKVAPAQEPEAKPQPRAASEPAAAAAGEPAAAAAGEPAATRAAAVKARHERFAALMTGVRLVGSFTRDDDEAGTPRREEYEISGATKIGTGDGWLVMARIRYGSVDVTVPVPVEVKWAGETPVITLDDVALPGLGTFSSRVVLDRGRYAGTWTHDAVGGHMFGRIVTTAPPAADRPPAAGGQSPAAGAPDVRPAAKPAP